MVLENVGNVLSMEDVMSYLLKDSLSKSSHLNATFLALINAGMSETKSGHPMGDSDRT